MKQAKVMSNYHSDIMKHPRLNNFNTREDDYVRNPYFFHRISLAYGETKNPLNPLNPMIDKKLIDRI